MLRSLLVLCAALGVPGPALGVPGPVLGVPGPVPGVPGSALGTEMAETLASLQARVVESAQLAARLELQHTELISRLSTCQQSDRDRSTAAHHDRTGLGAPCDRNADCLVADAVCSDGICSCVQGFWNYNNDTCRPISQRYGGEKCVGDQDCTAPFECIRAECKCKAVTHDQYEFRLAGGSDCTEGRVELRLSGGDWGHVCKDLWDQANAAVLCRSLGFRDGGEVLEHAIEYGASPGRTYHMAEVQCAGSEPHLLRCKYGGWRRHNCRYQDMVAAARCHGEQTEDWRGD